MRENNPHLTEERAEFLARHWGRETGEGTVILRGDPAHKIVNPVLYRYEEAHACWQQVRAPVLWIDGAETTVVKRLGLNETQREERRAAFRDLRYASVAGAGHMLHHDQPEAVAGLIEEFLAG
jgi:pimeloyl-ACP methyl ester carboxylesterase